MSNVESQKISLGAPEEFKEVNQRVPYALRDIPCLKGKSGPKVTLEQRKLYARQDGKEIPIQVDKPPETDFSKLML